MTLDDMYINADKHGIEIVRTHFPSTLKSMSYVENSTKAIAIDTTKFLHNCHLKEVIAEETGHIEGNAMYQLAAITNDKTWVRRAELQALSTAATTLVPLQELRPMLRRDRELWEIAEHFEVSEIVVERAVQHYTRKGAL